MFNFKELKLRTANFSDFSSVEWSEINQQHIRFLPQEQKNQLFTWKATKVHGSLYGYHLISYANKSIEVEIFCNICQLSFWQTPNSHLQSQGCPICSKIKAQSANIKNKKTTEQFIIEAKLVHGDKYDYSKVIYIDNKTNVEIICNTCNVSNWQLPTDHLKGHGCRNCGNLGMLKSHEQFVADVKKVHGNHLIVVGEYKGKRTKIKFKCADCGKISLNMPKNVLDGNKCDYCKSSKGEKQIKIILHNKNVKFETQWNFNKHKELRGKGTGYMSFDFYLPEHNLCIEYDGEQHYNTSDNGIFKTTKKDLENTQHRDSLKNQFCLDRGVRLLRIPYWVPLTEGLVLQQLEEKFTIVNVVDVL